MLEHLNEDFINSTAARDRRRRSLISLGKLFDGSPLGSGAERMVSVAGVADSRDSLMPERREYFYPSDRFSLITFAPSVGAIAGDRAIEAIENNPSSEYKVWGFCRLGKDYHVGIGQIIISPAGQRIYSARGASNWDYTENVHKRPLYWRGKDLWTSFQWIDAQAPVYATGNVYNPGNYWLTLPRLGSTPISATADWNRALPTRTPNSWDGDHIIPSGITPIIGSNPVMVGSPFSGTATYAHSIDANQFYNAAIAQNSCSVTVTEGFTGDIVLSGITPTNGVCDPNNYNGASGSHTYPGTTRTIQSVYTLQFTQPLNFMQLKGGVLSLGPAGSRQWNQSSNITQTLTTTNNQFSVFQFCSVNGIPGVSYTPGQIGVVGPFGNETHSLTVNDSYTVQLLPSLTRFATGTYTESCIATGQAPTIEHGVGASYGRFSAVTGTRTTYTAIANYTTTRLINYLPKMEAFSGVWSQSPDALLYSDDTESCLFLEETMTAALSCENGEVTGRAFIYLMAPSLNNGFVTRTVQQTTIVGREPLSTQPVDTSWHVLPCLGNYRTMSNGDPWKPVWGGITTTDYSGSETAYLAIAGTVHSLGPLQFSFKETSVFDISTLTVGQSAIIPIRDSPRVYSRRLTQKQTVSRAQYYGGITTQRAAPQFAQDDGQYYEEFDQFFDFSWQGYTASPAVKDGAVGKTVFLCKKHEGSLLCVRGTITAIAMTDFTPSVYEFKQDLRRGFRYADTTLPWVVMDHLNSVTITVDEIFAAGTSPVLPSTTGCAIFTLDHYTDLYTLYQRKRTAIKATQNGWDVYFCGTDDLGKGPQHAAIAKLSTNGDFAWDGSAKKTSSYILNAATPEWIKA
jgi:hypothetical protein